MKIKPIKTRVCIVNENLLNFITAHISKITEGDVVVITSKIVALSEGRVVAKWNQKIKEEIIRRESEFAIKTPLTWLTIKDGTVMASAGIDESNAKNGELILLPKDSFKSAVILRKKLMKYYGVKKIGILITDSRIMPLRAGVVGVALGYSGFKGLRDYRGKPDIFGRELTMTQTDIADSLATAAVLCMGEGNECQPLAVINSAPVDFTNTTNKKELIMKPKEDLYRPLFLNRMNR